MKTLFLLFLSWQILLGIDQRDIPFDKSKLENYNKNMDLSKYIGIIKNQLWIHSKNLSKEELINLVQKNHKFKVLTYEKVYGLLIEYDETNKKQLKYIETIKNNKSVNDVYNRVYEGENSYELMPMEPSNF